MKKTETRIAKSVLKEEIGWSWFIFLIKCLIAKRTVFRKTHWAKAKDPESEFVKRFSLASAIYLKLQERFGKDIAFRIMKRMLIPIG
jgi:hypothetical protein